MEKFVLGIDGGGTQTQCALFDTAGNERDIVNWGPTNHELLKEGYEDLRKELSGLMAYILKKHKLEPDRISKSVLGMAGVDTREQHKIISGILANIGFKDFILCNDAFLAIKAGCPSGYGIGVVNGTGCCVACMDPAGKMLQIGGQGQMTGDLGGGVYIGEQAISSVYNYLFRCGGYTGIFELLPEELRTCSKYDFMDLVREKISDGTLVISELNKVVFEAANAGDRIAVDILEAVGREFAASINGILRELQFRRDEQITIVLSGSINTKGNSPVLRDRITKDVFSMNKDKDIQVVILNRSPVVGAVIWALEEVSGRELILDRFFKNQGVAG